MTWLQIQEIEFSALRLSAWGLSLVLAWLLVSRIYDCYFKKHLEDEHRQVQNMGPRLVMASALLLASTNILAFTIPVLSGAIKWFHDVRAPALMSFVTLIVLLILFIDRLAYKRTDKWLWVICWVGFVHVAKWGSVWLGA